MLCLSGQCGQTGRALDRKTALNRQRRSVRSRAFAVSDASERREVVVVGSGIGGLTAGALLAWQGKDVLVLESHYRPGGAAHGFKEKDNQGRAYIFDTGPSFFAGLGEAGSLNPLGTVLRVLGEELEVQRYNPLGHFHLGSSGTLRRYCKLEELAEEVARFSPQGARELRAGIPYLRRWSACWQLVPHSLTDRMNAFSRPGCVGRSKAFLPQRFGATCSGATFLALPFQGTSKCFYVSLCFFFFFLIILIMELSATIAMSRAVPAIGRYLKGMAGMAEFAQLYARPTSELLDKIGIRDAFLRQLVDLECFLLSGMPADSTPAAEFAAVFGESDERGAAEFPVGGAEAIPQALARGLERHGGELRLKSHVSRVVTGANGDAEGVELRNGRVIHANWVITNASMWDTFSQGGIADFCRAERTTAEATPMCPSFVHLHAGVESSQRLECGHHVAVRSLDEPLDGPGNVRMVSVPTVWDPSLAPPGCEAVHVYGMEHYQGWQRGEGYADTKRQRCESLWDALELALPGAREACSLELLASPLSHEKWLRRQKGTYGPRIAAPSTFPGPQTKVPKLLRVGDSAAPGIGVPAVAGSGMLAANTLLTVREHGRFLDAADSVDGRA